MSFALSNIKTNNRSEFSAEHLDQVIDLEAMAETYMSHFLQHISKVEISGTVNDNIKPCVIWLTGLSAAGKTTISDDLVKKFKERSVTIISLDGDDIRQAIKLTGFDEQSRKKHNLTVGYIASKFESMGFVVIVSLISPYVSIREQIRQMCNRFIEVYVSTGIDECIKRDPKGLYAKALNGQLKDFTGISSPYEPPVNPEIVIDTTLKSISSCSDKIINFYELI
ncbi:adenylyl-sulfate kinase [Lacibacter sediminis]|uniref:Adenylyl-sulfate kinase n=1 Tax=Lacibacter sediminis TaxID=2760713 RepID=A0A7G5XET2_9BACT|nr:adenylyl-sulfate kinase [Lacibacter sediminis]QNA43985.1 adenylyl-sulfate kinase [Lacibacter sediminis]